MREFSNDDIVRKKFISAAVSRSVLPQHTKKGKWAYAHVSVFLKLCSEEEHPPVMELYSANPKEYWSDILRK